MAVVSSIVILGLTALLMIYFYRAHEIREMDSLLSQDTQIAVQRFRVDENGAITHHRTGTETLYDRPGSDWVWQLFTPNGQVMTLLDQSDSLGDLSEHNTALPFPVGRFENFKTREGLAMRGQLSEVSLFGTDEVYMLGIAAPSLHVAEEVEEAATFIGSTFLGLGCLLSLLVFTVVRTGLKPLARLQGELEQMQRGGGSISERGWPTDLQPIVGELRELDQRIASLIDRHRRQASDLAHSLKTPLAIMSRIVPDLPEQERAKIVDQTDRITTAVRRNLSRLRTGAKTANSCPVHDTVEDIVFAMEVLFRERDLDIRNKIDQNIVFRGDADDLKEIAGILLDNACKWAETTIHIDCDCVGPDLILAIGDDGPGMNNRRAATGSNADNTTRDGEFVSGIGLLIVEDIAELYEGSVQLGQSHLGGAEIRVTLPAGPRKS